MKHIIFRIEMYLHEDAPGGQTVRGGSTANNVRNDVAYYFLTYAGAALWQM